MWCPARERRAGARSAPVDLRGGPGFGAEPQGLHGAHTATYSDLMDVDEWLPEEAIQDQTRIHRQIRRNGRIYEVTASATADERLALNFSSCNDDGELISHLSGEIPPEDLAVAADVLQSILHGLASIYGTPGDGRAYTVAQKRLRHPNAYARWTEEEEERLRERFRAGATISQLSKDFGRVEGGIRSRLVRLGELPPATVTKPGSS